MENSDKEVNKEIGIGYSKKVLYYFFNPVNVGEIKDPDVTARVGSPACGDMIKLYVKIDGDRISDIKFRSYGCASNIATASLVTELVKGKTIDEARRYTFTDVVEGIGGLPKVKYHCAVLAVDALKIALDKWDVKRGVKPIDEKFVREILRGVIDPETGESILQSVKSIEIKDGIKIVVKGIPEEGKEIVREQVLDAFEDLDIKVELEFE